MLKYYDISPVLIDRLRSTPCWPYMDGFTEWLYKKRFSDATVQLYLFGIPSLGHWLLTNNVSVVDFGKQSLSDFQNEREVNGHLYHGSSAKLKAAFMGVRRFQEYLISVNIVVIRSQQIPENLLLTDFNNWMTEHRGIKRASLCCYIRYINSFIDALGQEPGLYDAPDIRHYFQDCARRSSVPTMKMVSTSIRVFLRYLVTVGLCDSSLPDAVPTIAQRKLSSLPRTISAEAIEKLIDSCDELLTTSLRDRAILMLLAQLALRAGDVASLQCSDIDWRTGRIRVSGKGRRECWLPLTQHLGDALADYWQFERPEVTIQHFFIKSNAPRGPISPSVVSSVVDRAVKRTRIDAPSKGAHLLRHSAASAMLSHGATLEQIGAVLRHRNLDTTTIYAKIDDDLLYQVASPWPIDSTSANSDESSVRIPGAGTC